MQKEIPTPRPIVLSVPQKIESPMPESGLFFHRDGDALNERRALRRDVVENQVPFHRFLKAFRIILVNPAQMRNHRVAEAQTLLTFIVEAALQAAGTPETAHEFFLFHFSSCHRGFPLYSLAFL